MKGLSYYLQTRADWVNAFDYAMKHPDIENEMISRLLSLKSSKMVKMPKPGLTKSIEEYADDDFETIQDPASPFAQSGLTDDEIDEMIAKLRR